MLEPNSPIPVGVSSVALSDSVYLFFSRPVLFVGTVNLIRWVGFSCIERLTSQIIDDRDILSRFMY